MVLMDHARSTGSPDGTGSPMNRIAKRIVVATFASALAFLPLSSPAQADVDTKPAVTKVTKVKSGGTVTTQRAIDWE